MTIQTNKFEMKIRQDDDSFVCDITNGSICLSVSNDGEEEDMQAIVDALNKPNVKWYSNNKLELDQHIEIMQLQGERDQWKAKYNELKAENVRLTDEISRAIKRSEKKGQLLLDEHTALKAKARKLADALKIIQNWQLPATGKFWDKEETQPMSYGACYGSNGERDFMRNVANEALAEYKQAKGQKIFIGNPNGYCHDCGFPVDECNCPAEGKEGEGMKRGWKKLRNAFWSKIYGRKHVKPVKRIRLTITTK